MAEIVLVLGEHNLEKGRDLAARQGWRKLKHICLGGERRQDSVKAGLDRLPILRVGHDPRWRQTVRNR